MIAIRPSEGNKQQWLDSRFAFLLDQYRDLEHVRFRSLCVINEARANVDRGAGRA